MFTSVRHNCDVTQVVEMIKMAKCNSTMSMAMEGWVLRREDFPQMTDTQVANKAIQWMLNPEEAPDNCNYTT